MNKVRLGDDPPLSALDWTLLLTGGAALVVPVSVYGKRFDGPGFLLLFAVAWLALMLLQYFVRALWRDSYGVSTVAALTLLAIAWDRYAWGSARGMHKWAFLALMAVFGAMFMFSRAADFRNSGSGGSCSAGGSCSSGGCGGGGCGGGGCGGCGGD
jgi:hypothetical protein